MSGCQMDYGCKGVDDLPRALRSAAVTGLPVAVQIGNAKDALTLARRIEATELRVIREERFVIIERRPPMSNVDAVLYAFVVAQVFMAVVAPFVAGLVRGAM